VEEPYYIEKEMVSPGLEGLKSLNNSGLPLTKFMYNFIQQENEENFSFMNQSEN
jgi:hypothetical protein